jgi:hypothetical protein
MFSFLTIEFVKNIFLAFILLLSFIYQVALLISLFRNRHDISLISAIKRGDKLSKAGIFFMVLMSIIVYQALFVSTGVQTDLVYLMGIIVCGDVGAKYVSNQHNIELKKIQKTNVEMDPKDFEDL